jgi:predicted Zn-dependent protease
MIETLQESTANIKAYGGSSAELAALGYNLGSTTLGLTLWNYSYVGYYTYGSSVRLAAKMNSAVVCIKYVSSKTTDEDRNTCVHEFGHALGFFGHTASSSTVMYPFGHSGYELQTSEKNHLKQVYD